MVLSLSSQGNPEGQNKLGMTYRDGQGVAQDSIRAYMGLIWQRTKVLVQLKRSELR